jgi:hypothetical protein
MREICITKTKFSPTEFWVAFADQNFQYPAMGFQKVA